MKPGRNDLCPCGSGKKYKHCWLNAGSVPVAAPADLSWRRLRALLDGFATEMLRFTAEAYGPLALHEAWDEFTGYDDLEFDPNTPFMQLFMPWFFHCWAPDPVATKVVNKSLHDVIPTAAYLSAKGRQLDPLLRRYLVSLLTAPFTFFEVLACDPGTGMILRDVMTQEEHAVTERAASRGMEPGDLLSGVGRSTDDARSEQWLCHSSDGESADHRTAGSHRFRAPGDHPSSPAGLGFRVACSLSRNRRSPVQSAVADAAEHRRRAAFDLLYDKICREDILRHAYALARANAGAPGVDGVTFEQIDASGSCSSSMCRHRPLLMH